MQTHRAWEHLIITFGLRRGLGVGGVHQNANVREQREGAVDISISRFANKLFLIVQSFVSKLQINYPCFKKSL